MKRINAEKQKDKRTLTYDPDSDNISRLINEFQHYRKNAKFYKEYSEMEVFEIFKEIRWMKTMDEANGDGLEESRKRQRRIRIKYESYIDYERWSDSPYAQTTRPFSTTKKLIIIWSTIVLFALMLVIVVGLNKWW
ncbi:Uncharacterised protein [Metamycoplasma arthritidis]|uniref:Conserved hypothetical membrane protein n=1 Tax=Metamycoplasma arthritidis (strain 158L3-1) TaxID=243272 RepID=B3PMU4_META1|nr:hypothetical protein [Metamycoplasma arthritidis]ACF07346.1 conserved hypothetical membrane protein [Metamycoplasma arthritidis 158L3-1]VEU78869.1 Uncharacterised protein [Metamycoplasma arthritidis]